MATAPSGPMGFNLKSRVCIFRCLIIFDRSKAASMALKIKNL